MQQTKRIRMKKGLNKEISIDMEVSQRNAMSEMHKHGGAALLRLGSRPAQGRIGDTHPPSPFW